MILAKYVMMRQSIEKKKMLELNQCVIPYFAISWSDIYIFFGAIYF